MSFSPFKIYDASAGSGKTHTLTKEYLKIILSTKKGYGQILALTFTNKAVDEMKRRILESLFEFSNTTEIKDASPLFLEVRKELKLDNGILRKKAGQTLKDILHNYAFFDISTLDKFTHRLIRTFAKDLKIPQNFEVVLDRDLLLNEAVSRLIYKAGKDLLLTKVLLEFALEKIEDDKSWDIGLDLFKIGKLIFDENHKKQLEQFDGKTIADFLELKKLINNKVKVLKENCIAVANAVLEFILASGLEFTDFPRETLPNNFKKIVAGEFNPTRLYSNTLTEKVPEGKILKSGIPFPAQEVEDRIINDFVLLNKSIYKIAFLNNAYVSIVPLTVLNSIQQEIKKLQEERDQLSISEFNTIISKEVKNQPAPFIYERLGEKYRHYFIDEFQDTSVMQWENLQPLIDNALAGQDEQGKTGSLFLVGDTKQAIYRWRGGRAEQFLKLVNETSNPFQIKPDVSPLETNYRSHAEIITFNNDFFQKTNPFLSKRDYRQLFIDGNKQLLNAKKGGYVELRFMNEDDIEDKDALYGIAVLETIQKVDPNKEALNNICILVRSNKHGVALASFLTQNAIRVISTESLLVVSSENVRFLINLLRYLNEPSDISVSFAALSFLSKGRANRNQFITTHLYDLASLLQNTYGFEALKMPQKSVFDILELAIKLFDLAPDTDVYLISLMDFALDLENKEETGIQLFLENWEKKKEKLSISAPAISNAVRIMTIHKSKGLEFPIVIFPYANEDIYKRNDKKLWLPVNLEEYLGFDRLLVSEKNEVAQYGDTAALLFREEEEKMELDAFNILYVALTRAEHSLFVISKKELTKSGAPNTKRYSGLFIHYLKEKGLWDSEKDIYSFGYFEHVNKVALQTPQSIPYQYTFKNRPNFKILASAGSLWDTDRESAIAEGNLLHHIMSLITSEKDIAEAIYLLSRRGDIASENVEQIKQTINAIITHSQLIPYYKEGLKVMNEKDIITKNGKLLRPDRLVFENNTVVIIDYKTGKKDPTYHQQVYEYADALEEMGYLVAHKIIVYTTTTVSPEFI